MTEMLIWVTWMECFTPPVKPQTLAQGFSFARETISPDDYLALYRIIGEQSKWDTRLGFSLQQLATFLNAPTTYVFVLRYNAEAVGLCEFEQQENARAELQHFGLVPNVQGQRLALPFLENAMARIFHTGATRIWLHTDEEDSPAAQKVYAKAGFTAYDRKYIDATPL
jgi:RimJ/RimL family protein N-acetyltransferase